jgi:arsenite methyltransferase
MDEQKNDEVRAAVREQYANVARTEGQVGCSPSCCGPGPSASLALGYSEDDLAAVPEGANMGLGCGNPQALAALKPGRDRARSRLRRRLRLLPRREAGRPDGRSSAST